MSLVLYGDTVCLIWVLFSLKKENNSYMNSSHQGIWIILSIQVIISRKGTLLLSFSYVFFLSLWAPQMECHLVSLYSREGRHLYGRYLKNSAARIKTSKSKWMISITVKYVCFKFWVNCPYNSFSPLVWSMALISSTLPLAECQTIIRYSIFWNI